ncbi:O-antigen polymerase [Paraliobacillus sp. JSM ZJ581]|uniref:O-antigen polymerase n=1 Tax=Paraliobacillus sp. JSM ZJ581 TaxID=3342118 RepID=UPI0035A8F3AD
MKKTKILIVILLLCILINSIFLNTIAGVLLMITHVMLLSGSIINYNRSTDIFSPISITFIAFIISFSIKGIYILAIDKLEPNQMILPLVYYIIFLGFFMFGLIVMPIKKIPVFYINLASREIKFNKIKYLTLFVAFIGFFIYFAKIGTVDFSYLVSNLLDNRRIFQNSGGLYFQTIILLLIQTALYINVIIAYLYKKEKWSWVIYLILVINIFITFTLGGRGMIILPIISIFFYKFKITNIVEWKKIFLFGSFFIVFSGWYGLFRDGLTTGFITSLKQLRLVEFIENILNRYVQFDNFIKLVGSPTDFTFGKSFVDFILSPIPRSILPDKPYNFNSQMTQIYHPEQFDNFIVTDFTVLGELLLNFGILGLVFGGFIFGILIGYFNKIYTTFNDAFFYLWYPFMMLKPMSILYGGMINSTVNMMFLLETPILILLWLFYSKKKSKI